MLKRDSEKFLKIAVIFLLFLTLFTSTSGCKDLESGIQAFENKDYEKSIQALKDYLKDNPDDLEAHLFLGKAYFEKGELDLAQKEFEEILDGRSKHTQALYHLGLVLIEKKDYSEAKKIFEKGLKLKNDKALFHNGMGLVQMSGITTRFHFGWGIL